MLKQNLLLMETKQTKKKKGKPSNLTESFQLTVLLLSDSELSVISYSDMTLEYSMKFIRKLNKGHRYSITLLEYKLNTCTSVVYIYHFGPNTCVCTEA